MTNLTHTIVQAFYTRYEEYVSEGIAEDESALLASKEMSEWLKTSRFGNLTETQITEAETALTNTRLYFL